MATSELSQVEQASEIERWTKNYQVQPVRDLGREFYFLLDSQVDHIQGVIRSGRFYEKEELELIAEFAGSPKRILDVGANIGNHSIYFAHRFNPELTIPVEPNPRVIPMLRANTGLNWHPSFDLSLIGYGFSDRAATGVSVVLLEENLGASRLRVDERGSVPIVAADAVLPDRSFDLIKVDVEGMEREVVAGMSGILRRSNALLFLEVLIKNIEEILPQLDALGYTYKTSYQRYGHTTNLLFEKTT